MKKRNSILLLIFIFALIAKFWIGIYTHDEFGGKILFLKHRPIWQTFFYSPRGMSDLKTSEMSSKKQKEQLLFDEFILQKQNIE